MPFQKKECIAMLLAGGQGSRLTVLTAETAKPAVPFGGKYRIVDFPLSNCVNSGIDTVGILTQYQPLQLNEYIGNGQPWGLNSSSGGIHVLPPYARSGSSEWYRGTANAIYQNFAFIRRYHPENVLILSGDHIYRMDYAALLSYHKEKCADCTIAVLNVPLDEASRFGIMKSDAEGRIESFEEKPKVPQSTQASMGIYIFRWEVLEEFLTRDDADPQSENDFGKNVIPAMLAAKKRLFAYPFGGYWKDVGTIDSLWEANMDTLGDNPPLKLWDGESRIYARNYAQPGSFIAEGSRITASFVAEGCTVKGKIENSVISTGCTVEEGAEVQNSFLMPDSTVKKGSRIRYAIVGEGSVVGENSLIGAAPEETEPDLWGITVVGREKSVPAGTVLKAKETY